MKMSNMLNGGKLKGDINAQHPSARWCGAELPRDAKPAETGGLYLALMLTSKLQEGGARQNSVPYSSFEAFFELCTFTVLPKKLTKQNTLPIQRYMAKVSAYMLRDVFV